MELFLNFSNDRDYYSNYNTYIEAKTKDEINDVNYILIIQLYNTTRGILVGYIQLHEVARVLGRYYSNYTEMFYHQDGGTYPYTLPSRDILTWRSGDKSPNSLVT